MSCQVKWYILDRWFSKTEGIFLKGSLSSFIWFLSKMEKETWVGEPLSHSEATHGENMWGEVWEGAYEYGKDCKQKRMGDK